MTDVPTRRVPKVLWWRKHWHLRENPFPGEAIARLGGEDPRENGLLFQPDVQREQVDEAIEKFVIGAAFSGLKFAYLWSLGSGLSADQRGFGKSSLLQYIVEHVNHDFGTGGHGFWQLPLSLSDDLELARLRLRMAVSAV